MEELFGISACGDYGVVPDDPAQYAQELDPSSRRGERVLQCGYYGPGTAYLTIEAYEWPSVSAAVDGVEAMQVEREAGDSIPSPTWTARPRPGTRRGSGSDPATYEYAVAIDELVVVVSLSDTPVGEGAETVGQDLADQTYELYRQPCLNECPKSPPVARWPLELLRRRFSAPRRTGREHGLR